MIDFLPKQLEISSITNKTKSVSEINTTQFTTWNRKMQALVWFKDIYSDK